MFPAVAPLSSPSPSGLSCIGRPDQAQLQRFELKYVIAERVALAIRQFIRSQLVPDEFAAESSDHAYAVHTLYLDSPNLALYEATRDGQKNRFKLRVRFYDDGPEAPAFFEIKRRQNDCVSKLRAKVKRSEVPGLLRGDWPQLRHLAKPDGKSLFALQEFCRLMRQYQATPRSHVKYRREAWMSPENNSLRLTFDRQVECEPQLVAQLHTSVNGTAVVEPFEKNVIFELKFTSRMPTWCTELVRTFDLVRGGAAKYAAGIALMGEHRVSNRGIALTTPEVRVPDGLPLWEPQTIGAR